ncbi:MAG: hypothetical protein PHE55_00105 [Methylococcaceae bacterium]|nr:hypothetical protein [Methylococcaceae bacterium]
MSNENNPTNAVANVIQTLKTNPKAMYAAVGAVIVVVLAVLMSGGDEGVSQMKTAPLTPGQKVTVKNPNIGNTVLVASPGPLGLADSDNENDSKNNDSVICRQVVSGTTATVEEETTVNYIPFVKLTLNDGDCSGKTGWMPKVNINP